MKVYLGFNSPKCPCESPHTYTKTTNLHLGCLGVEDLLLFIFLIFILCILYFRVFFQPFVLGLPAQNLLAAAFKVDWKSDKGRRSPGFSFKGSTLNTRHRFQTLTSIFQSNLKRVCGIDCRENDALSMLLSPKQKGDGRVTFILFGGICL